MDTNQTVLNYLTLTKNRFSVFQQVFNEFERSYQRILDGDALASENIELISQYLKRNCEKFEQFADQFLLQVHQILPKNSMIGSELVHGFVRYLAAVRTLLTSQRENLAPVLIETNAERCRQSENINLIFQNIVPL